MRLDDGSCVHYLPPVGPARCRMRIQQRAILRATQNASTELKLRSWRSPKRCLELQLQAPGIQRVLSGATKFGARWLSTSRKSTLKLQAIHYAARWGRRWPSSRLCPGEAVARNMLLRARSPMVSCSVSAICGVSGASPAQRSLKLRLTRCGAQRTYCDSGGPPVC